MYEVWIDDMLMPIAPEKMSIKIKNRNETRTLINEGEINVAKVPGLTDINFTVLLPNQAYPFTRWEGNTFHDPIYFINRFSEIKKKAAPVLLDIIRVDDDGELIYTDGVSTKRSATGDWFTRDVTKSLSDAIKNKSSLIAKAVSAVQKAAATDASFASQVANKSAWSKDGGTVQASISALAASSSVVGAYRSANSQRYTLEDYTIDDDANDGDDIKVELSFKLWQDYSTKYITFKDGVATVVNPATTASASSSTTASDGITWTTTPKETNTYVTVAGDTLCSIAKRFLGSDTLWEQIYNLNADYIESCAKANGHASSLHGGYIFPGMTLRLK